MKSFLTRHQSQVKGVLSGLDRVRFRGTVRWLASCRGLGSFMWSARVLLKDFKDWSKSLTDDLKRGAKQMADAAGRKVEHLKSRSTPTTAGC
jgi:hypothetical protein